MRRTNQTLRADSWAKLSACRRARKLIAVNSREAILPNRVGARVLGAGALAVLSVFSAGAVADPGPTPEPVQRSPVSSGNAALDTVTVEARRQRELLEQRISTFVSSVTIRSWDESMARWRVPICALVAGLPRAEALWVYGRILKVASDAGVPLALHEKCAPNFLVVVTPEPDVLLKMWWGDNPRLFNTDRGIGGINRFIQSAQAVRVWYNACSSTPDAAKNFALRGGPRCSGVQIGSKLSWGTVRVIYSVIVVVDAGRIEDLTIGPLADYVAMIGLAQIRRNSDLRDAPTILRLFADTDATRPQGLSSWDQALLKALYDVNAGSVTQLAEIKLNMERALLQ